MTAAQRVLVIGGGFSGMSAAIEMRKHGLDVDLVEIDPSWRNYGAGISLGGATLRAFGQIGILEEFLDRGAASNGVDLFLDNGTPLSTLPTPHIAGPDVPGGGAIMRPVLAEILANATRASGANVRLGCTFTAIAQCADGAHVTFTDGSTVRYDLVVGADGLYSKVRAAVFPDAPQPRYSGQGVWRAVVPRPPEVQRAAMWLGPKVKTGVNPVSKDMMYLFVNQDYPENVYIDPLHFVPMLKDLLASFKAPLMQQIRAELNDTHLVVYRPLDALLMPRPWYKDRVILIGDAVHATTPHLASGACIGIEDAIVLADELSKSDDLPQALHAFQERRFERCRMVVENSNRLGEIEIAGGDKEEHSSIMRASLLALADPI